MQTHPKTLGYLVIGRKVEFRTTEKAAFGAASQELRIVRRYSPSTLVSLVRVFADGTFTPHGGLYPAHPETIDRARTALADRCTDVLRRYGFPMPVIFELKMRFASLTPASSTLTLTP